MKHSKRNERRQARELKQTPREMPPALKKAIDDIAQAVARQVEVNREKDH